MASADLTSKRDADSNLDEDGLAHAPSHPLVMILRRLAGRVVAVVTTLLGLLFLTFSMGRLLPADPVLAITGAEVSKEVYDRVYNELGLGRPIWVQFLNYVQKVATGDLGTSATTGQPILTDLLTIFPATIELAVIAMIVGALVGVPLGITAAVRRGTIIDHIARIIALAGHSIPIFWTGLMALFIFYAKLKLVGASGRVDVFYEGLVTPVTGFLLIDSAIERQWDVFRSALGHIILPGTILGYYSVAYISRMSRSFMLEQLGQEYITTARAKGLGLRKVVWRHAFRNIRVQLLTIMALTFGGLLEGAVLIETVFGWPGLGQYLTRGLQMNDMNVVMGAVLTIGAVFLTINILSDVLYRILDPRTR
ncbi:ABC transporter permease [Rhizobium mongolense]|uniref:Peptide/nickel transport system permease protein n=2 Tax=Rhizobium mongolense TaxID=57676 RepID=A0ABR6IQC0_9HYPH|nr:ABC transporter permease [Rhizobium mongolense]MBB4230082.1 peptide/nickel transport system permease protein [Rhizobium mongolense]TVZ72788.1 peptide/nickel transport system permease protein [Rhizobium mongolense USDA 1844]